MSLSSLFSQLGLTANAAENSPVIDVPRERLAELATRIDREFSLPLSLMYATDERATSQSYYVHVVFAVDAESTLFTLRASIPATDLTYPSLTATVMAAHWYERLIWDQFGIVAVGHPDWRRLMHHQNIPAGTFPMRKDFAWNTKLNYADEPYPMHAVEGQGVYEIPVGPIHAGIIEPGHFRFNVRGERILTLEGKLFFKHKGVEKLLEGKTPAEAVPFVEHVTGNMSVAHAIAFAEAVERICGTQISERAKVLRSFLNEVERVAMHLFDVGNMGGMGTGFTFMAAQCFRLNELVRRLGVDLTGHRFFRGAVVPGGLSRDISIDALKKAVEELNRIEADFKKVIDIAYGKDGLMERFETTGVLTASTAKALGGLGLPVRASGVDRDLRRERPYAAYATFKPTVITQTSGDVRARFDMRVQELAVSFTLLRDMVAKMPTGSANVAVTPKAGSAYGWSEGWLGEVLDWVRLDANGTIERCVIRDPSFCNWSLFGEIGPGNIVPDFPLCNKSLNLSYSGTDM